MNTQQKIILGLVMAITILSVGLVAAVLTLTTTVPLNFGVNPKVSAEVYVNDTLATGQAYNFTNLDPGSLLVVSVDVQNTGNVAENVTVVLSGNWLAGMDGNNTSIPKGSWLHTILSVNVPVDAEAGTHSETATFTFTQT